MAPGGQLVTTARSARTRAARRLGKRAFRKTDRRFLVEGPQAVREALARTDVVVELFVTPDAAAQHGELVERASAQTADVHVVTPAVMAELAQTVTPQGVVAVAMFCDASLDTVLAAGPSLVVVLAAVRDPGNAGTVVRVADAAGADAVLFPDGSVDPYNAKCVRASAGSLFHLPFVTGGDAASAVESLRAAGLKVLAADGRATRTVDEADLAAPTAWLFGNEAWGLSPELAGLANETVAVPIYGSAESLNLATAAAVCLYASARAQRTVNPGR